MVSQVIEPSSAVTQFSGFTLVEGPTELPGPSRNLWLWALAGSAQSTARLVEAVIKARPARNGWLVRREVVMSEKARGSSDWKGWNGLVGHTLPVGCQG